MSCKGTSAGDEHGLVRGVVGVVVGPVPTEIYAMGQSKLDLNLGRQGLLKAGNHDVEQIDRLARRRRPYRIGVLLELQRQAVAIEHVGHDLGDGVDAGGEVGVWRWFDP